MVLNFAAIILAALVVGGLKLILVPYKDFKALYEFQHLSKEEMGALIDKHLREEKNVNRLCNRP